MAKSKKGSIFKRWEQPFNITIGDEEVDKMTLRKQELKVYLDQHERKLKGKRPRKTNRKG